MCSIIVTLVETKGSKTEIQISSLGGATKVAWHYQEQEVQYEGFGEFRRVQRLGKVIK